jgi:hypothetical protein
LNHDGGFIDVTGVVGNADGPTDWIPDVGHGTIAGIRWLTLNPEMAQIAPGAQQVVDVTLDSRALVGGTFTRYIRTSSNDPAKPVVYLPVTLQVTGIPDIAFDRDSVYFDSGFVGFVTTRTLAISNPGTDSLRLVVVSSDPPVFAMGGSTAHLAVGETWLVEVLFRPGSVGAFVALLNLSTNVPDRPDVVIPVAGVARQAPEAAILPDPLTLSVRQNQTDSIPLVIGNRGPGDLVWRGSVSGIFPGIQFSPDSGVVSGADSAIPSLVVRGTGLPDGVIDYLVTVFTNDPRSQRTDIPAQLEVIGVRPGDVNADFITNASDIVRLVSFIFQEGPQPHPGTGDPNCDDSITVADIMFLVRYVFQSGPAPDCP